ncbi:hypothetical protein [Aneurinibacillus tyrosinisolvens]|uniref:hypothetical protein n=1 Tax=Aneurinibacillus tyrosinisolvens TaxID=1443435 RepID=UPI00063EEC2B|nr:hypothetical protein [Aneurinibacillus tyrosinisolvens]
MKKYATKNNLIFGSVILFALGTPVLASNVAGTDTKANKTVTAQATATASAQSVGQITATPISPAAGGTAQTAESAVTKVPLDKTLDQFLAEQSKNKAVQTNSKQTNPGPAAPVQNKPKNSTTTAQNTTTSVNKETQYISEEVTNLLKARGLNKAQIDKMERLLASGMPADRLISALNEKGEGEVADILKQGGGKKKGHYKEKHGDGKEKHKKKGNETDEHDDD